MRPNADDAAAAAAAAADGAVAPPATPLTSPHHPHAPPQIAGIIAGILQSADFPCEVSALLTRPDDGGTRDRTVYLIKFSPEVMDREERLEKKG